MCVSCQEGWGFLASFTVSADRDRPTRVDVNLVPLFVARRLARRLPDTEIGYSLSLAGLSLPTGCRSGAVLSGFAWSSGGKQLGVCNSGPPAHGWGHGRQTHRIPGNQADRCRRPGIRSPLSKLLRCHTFE